MKASEFIKCLQRAIDLHGDLQLVVGYDSSHAEVVDEFESNDDGDGGSYGFGPRNLVLDYTQDESGMPMKERCFRI